MILGFKQKFPWGEPTYFREKILRGVVDQLPIPPDVIIKPKLHTIREDKHNRWKAGMSIQMVYRGANYSIADHFNKDIPELDKCRSVQTISIKWFEVRQKSMTGEEILKMTSWTSSKRCQITVDGNNINFEQLQVLALNDGFTSATEFLMWFNKDFSGKIIGWTDLKY